MVKHTQTIRRLLPTNCLSVFDHFVRLALKYSGTCQASSFFEIQVFFCASVFLYSSPRIKCSSQIPDSIHHSGMDLLSRVRYLDMTVAKLKRSQRVKEMISKNNWTSCKKNCKFSSVYFCFSTAFREGEFQELS